jgi:hypothetical protein
MSNLEKFMERGADCVAGSIILRGKTMANVRNGDLILTEDGLAELEVDEVPVRMTPKPAAKTAKAPKATKVDPVPEVEIDPLDDLLGDLE